ncbi:MAG: hypothetical protein QG642_483, partial [Patescibacteria group bacterium]|nr:hypothetical protein [Patescibacteria group bacterium]
MKKILKINASKMRNFFRHFKVGFFVFLTTLLILQSFLFTLKTAWATTLLSDNFTGTTISTDNWVEVDAGGIGGTSGNMQQNGSMSMTGSATWGANYVRTVNTYDRSLGSLEMEADVTCSANGIPGIGYGDPGILTGGGQSYTLYISSRVVHFSRQLANANAEDVVAYTCTAGAPFHIRIAIDPIIGAALYINGSGTAAATLTGGNFNNKSFFLSGHSGSATLVDNFAVSGLSAATEPDAPTDLTATPSSTQVALAWSAPANNGGASITDYLVEYKLSSEPTVWSTFADGVSATASALVTGLTNGLSYDFRVSATNSVGTSIATATATATPALSAPSATRSLTASPNGNGQVDLSWTAPLSDGGAAISDYIVEYKLASELVTWTTFVDDVSNATTASVTGLTNGSSYNFRVSAINSVGTGTASATATATPVNATLVDAFTGTTIDPAKWTETDATGLGGTSGRVQQNGSLNITPSAAGWSSQDGVSTVATFDRTNGDVSMEVSVTRDTCGTGVGPVAFGYGDINFTTGSSASYILLSNATAWELYYWSGGVNQASSPASVSGLTSCTNGVPVTFRLVALQAGGAKVYINGSETANATYGLGTFTNKGFWIGG